MRDTISPPSDLGAYPYARIKDLTIGSDTGRGYGEVNIRHGLLIDTS